MSGRVQDTDDMRQVERVSKALRWVMDSPEVSTIRMSAIKVPSLAPPDALMEDPRRIIIAADSIVEGAGRHGAPSEVVDALREITDRYRAGAERLDALDFTLQTLKGLRGRRDRFEIEPLLVAALEKAPDERNRRKLEQMLTLVRRPMSMEAGFPFLAAYAPNETTLDATGCDWLCCGLTCAMCGEGCILCCIAACILC